MLKSKVGGSRVVVRRPINDSRSLSELIWPESFVMLDPTEECCQYSCRNSCCGICITYLNECGKVLAHRETLLLLFAGKGAPTAGSCEEFFEGVRGVLSGRWHHQRRRVKKGEGRPCMPLSESRRERQKSSAGLKGGGRTSSVA